MSVNVEEAVVDPLCGGLNKASKSSTPDSLEDSKISTSSTLENDTSDPTTPTPFATSFTIDLGQGKQVDQSKLKELARKSQARHQRVHSMSSVQKQSPPAQKAPNSAKLPRKAQGYNSEGYFSSDQEEGLCSTGKHRIRPSTASGARHLKSPDRLDFRKMKKPIENIMTRSDTQPSRYNLKLPLRSNNSSYLRDKTQSSSNLSGITYRPMFDIIDQSPDGAMLTDISSPDFEMLAPEYGEARTPTKNHRAVSEMPDLVSKTMTKLYIDDDQESNSSAGTYTIEDNNYTEEQKEIMSIDRERSFALENNNHITKREPSNEKDPEIIYDFERVETFRPRKDKNVLEINCTYSSNNDLAAQTSKQIKSTRNYLEKLKTRVRNISEKTVPKHDENAGSITSVTTTGVLSSKLPSKIELRRRSLSKSDIYQTDYIHRLTRETSVPVVLPSDSLQYEKTHINDHLNLDPIEKTYSTNRGKHDNSWIQEWADSVKKFNNIKNKDSNSGLMDRPPMSPRREHSGLTSRLSDSSMSPTKIPSPVGTLTLCRQTPDLIPSNQDTDAYLQKTQNVITNLQARLNSPVNYDSRLPIPQLSRSNSLNYRIKRVQSPNPTSGSNNQIATQNIGSIHSGSISQNMNQIKNHIRNNSEGRFCKLDDLNHHGNMRRSTSYSTVQNNTPELQRKPVKPREVQSAQCRRPETRQAVLSRLTKSRSSTREVQPKVVEKTKKLSPRPQQKDTKDIEFSNWKKRSSYDPMKAAQEGRKRQQQLNAKKSDKDDNSSPSHSSPVHRSQSFHTTNMASLAIDYSSDEEPIDNIMSTSTLSGYNYIDNRKFIANDARRDSPKSHHQSDKRKTFIVDSDSATTSPRNSSSFSQEKNYLSDTEGESCNEDLQVVYRGDKRGGTAKQRLSGDYSLTSSTTSINQKKVQPRYLDISKYKSESNKTFLKRDPSKTYVGVLNTDKSNKISARQLEIEQKRQELEKWKRRASYDPRKAAAQAKVKNSPKPTSSNVLRSQSFHGPMVSQTLQYQTIQMNDYDASSDNDF